MNLVTFDVETSGIDTGNDRILTACVRADGKNWTWIIDPGVEVPEAASKVNGLTTEFLRQNGRKDVAAAIREILDTIDLFASQGYVVVGFNHAFDLAILEAECKRHGINTLSRDYLYFDPLVWDRQEQRFRKGSRKLADVARVYGIPVEQDRLHEASYDVELTERLAQIILEKEYRPLRELQELQALWKKDWADRLTEWFSKQGKVEEDGSPILVSGNFPW